MTNSRNEPVQSYGAVEGPDRIGEAFGAQVTDGVALAPPSRDVPLVWRALCSAGIMLTILASLVSSRSSTGLRSEQAAFYNVKSTAGDGGSRPVSCVLSTVVVQQMLFSVPGESSKVPLYITVSFLNVPRNKALPSSTTVPLIDECLPWSTCTIGTAQAVVVLFTEMMTSSLSMSQASTYLCSLWVRFRAHHLCP